MIAAYGFWSFSTWNSWFALLSSIVVVGGGVIWMIEDGDKVVRWFEASRNRRLQRKFEPILHQLKRNGGSKDVVVPEGTLADAMARIEAKVDYIREEVRETTALLHRHLGEHEAQKV